MLVPWRSWCGQLPSRYDVASMIDLMCSCAMALPDALVNRFAVGFQIRAVLLSAIGGHDRPEAHCAFAPWTALEPSKSSEITANQGSGKFLRSQHFSLDVGSRPGQDEEVSWSRTLWR